MESFLHRDDLLNTLVSVIVPVYNAEEYVGRCLTSLLGNHIAILKLS